MMQHIEGALWMLSLGALLLAAYVSSRTFLLIVAIVFATSTLVVIPLHFYRAWRRWTRVSNKRQYAAWVGFETAATFALISLGIYSVVSR